MFHKIVVAVGDGSCADRLESAAVSLASGTDAEVLFQALSEKAGLAAFWTDDCDAQPVVGSISRFRFPSGAEVQVRIDDLEPGRRVAWTMLTDTFWGPKWTGTKVTWELKPGPQGFTEVLFRQANWPADLNEGDWHTSLAGLTFAWAGFLRALKGFADTGNPQPHFATVPAR